MRGAFHGVTIPNRGGVLMNSGCMRADEFFAVRMMPVAWTFFAWAAVASCWTTGILRVRLLLAWSGGGCFVGWAYRSTKKN